MVEENPDEVVWKYNGRGQIENHIKEIKSGFGMEWMLLKGSETKVDYSGNEQVCLKLPTLHSLTIDRASAEARK